MSIAMGVRLKMTGWLLVVVSLCWLGGTQAGLAKITEDNWRDLLQGEWMVEL
jgi:hypothetical protein